LAFTAQNYPDLPKVYRTDEKSSLGSQQHQQKLNPLASFSTMTFEEWFLSNERRGSPNSPHRKSVSSADKSPTVNKNLSAPELAAPNCRGDAPGTAGSGSPAWPPKIKGIEMPKKLGDVVELRVYKYADIVQGTSSCPRYETLKFPVSNCEFSMVANVLSSVQSPNAKLKKSATFDGAEGFQSSPSGVRLGAGNTNSSGNLLRSSVTGYSFYFFNSRMNAWRKIVSDVAWNQAKLTALETSEPVKVMVRSEYDAQEDDEEVDHFDSTHSFPAPSKHGDRLLNDPSGMSDVIVTSRPISGADESIPLTTSLTATSGIAASTASAIPSTKSVASAASTSTTPREGYSSKQQTPRIPSGNASRRASVVANSRLDSRSNSYGYIGALDTPPPMMIAPTFGRIKSKASITSIQLMAPQSARSGNSFLSKSLSAIEDNSQHSGGADYGDDDNHSEFNGSIHSHQSGRTQKSAASQLQTHRLVNKNGHDGRYPTVNMEDCGRHTGPESFILSQAHFLNTVSTFIPSSMGHKPPARDPRQSILTMTYSRELLVDPSAPSVDKQNALAERLEQRLLRTKF
jgi:hypothetical protein